MSYYVLVDELKEDILTKIPEDKWPFVQDVFLEDWPRAIYPYYFIQNCINWKTNDPSLDVNIFCPHGSWEDGTVVITRNNNMEGSNVINEFGLTLYIFTLKGESSQLRDIILKTSRIDWRQGPFLYAIQQEHWNVVKGSLIELGLESKFFYQSGYHWLPKEKAITFEVVCPSDVYIAPLTLENLSTIDKAWPHQRAGSEDYLKELISYNGGLGIFLKSDNSLCSWVIKTQILSIGILQTIDQHKRKGYAKILIKSLSKQLAKEGIDAYCFTVSTNILSQSLFKSLGFTFVDFIMFDKVQPFDKK